MTKMEEAIQRIKILECPTGQVEERVAGILAEYGIANKNEITVKREEELDNDGAQGYSAQLLNNKDQAIKILATSGLDDYVAKVVDVHIN